MRTWLVALMICSGPLQALACSCIGFERPCERLRSDAVFVGRVLETTPVKHPMKEPGSWTYGYAMRFSVDEPLRGEVGTEVTIHTGGGGGDCGTPLRVGERFLIFAYKNDDGELWTGMCSGNRHLSAGTADDQVLAEYRQLAKQTTGTIFGKVVRSNPVWREDDLADSESGLASGIVVEAKSEQASVAVRADKDGSYEFSGLPNGKYTVSPELPAGWDYDREYADRYDADVSNGRCARINFAIKPSTRIRGHVTFPPGFQEKSIEVLAIPVHMNVAGQFSGKWDFTDDKGRFDLWPLPPGDYFVGVNINTSPKPDAPFPPTYYPGVTKRDAAQVIHLKVGEVRDIELPLPELAQPRTVRFVAIGLDGKPMKHVYVQLEDLRYPGDAASYVNVDLDSNGAGTMTIYAGYSYHLHASQYVGGDDWCAKPVLVPAGTAPVQARFVMYRKDRSCWIKEIDGLK